MAAFDLDSEHRARQSLGDLALDLDFVLLLGQIPFVSNAQKMRTKYRLVRTNYGSKRGLVGNVARLLSREHQARGRDRPKARRQP